MSAPDVDRIELAVRALREGRAALLERSARDVAAALGRAGERFLDPRDPLRIEALERLPASSAYSAEMAERVLDGMAGDWTAARLNALLDSDPVLARALDGFTPHPSGGRLRALGPPVAVHVCAGSVPGVSVTSLIRSLLVKSAVLLKPGRGDDVLPELFHAALRGIDGGLAGAATVMYWEGARSELTGAAAALADLVVAYGSDESVAAVRDLVPVSTPFVGYHHRVSVALIGPGALGDARLDRTAADLARDVATFDQRGCVSPVITALVGVDEAGVRRFAEAVAGALEGLAGAWPSGPLEPGEWARLHQVRGTLEMKAGGATFVVHGAAQPWTVVVGDPGVAEDAPGRWARLAPFPDLDAVLQTLAPWRPHLQGVAAAGFEDRTGLAERLARAGVVRIAELGRSSFPPPWWRHDGIGPLAPLVRWTEVEAD